MAQKKQDKNAPSSMAGQLKALRIQSKLSQMDVAERLQKTQSWVSLVEGGRIALNSELVDQWCGILHLPQDEIEQFKTRFQRENEQFVTWQTQLVSSQSLQMAISEHERSAKFIRYFQVTFFNGLLQVPSYIEAVFGAVNANEVDSGFSEFLQTRLARQSILHDQSIQVKSLIFESAFSFMFGDAKVMVSQLEHIAYLIEKDLCDISIVPNSVALPTMPYSNWTMFDDEIAFVELSPGQVAFKEAVELAPLIHSFVTMWDLGVKGADAIALVFEAARQYERHELFRYE